MPTQDPDEDSSSDGVREDPVPEPTPKVTAPPPPAKVVRYLGPPPPVHPGLPPVGKPGKKAPPKTKILAPGGPNKSSSR